MLSSDGARHGIVLDYYLGSEIDFEPDGQPDATVTGDDNDGGEDEDGAVFNSLIIAGQPVDLTVTASAAGKLDAWFDFNNNGNWADDGEQIFASQALTTGENNLNFNVPAGLVADVQTVARFRFSSVGGLLYTGFAEDGEVEDYLIEILADSDGDGEPDLTDLCPEDPNKTAPGICGCGVADTDTDGDGTPDCNDNCPSDPNKTEPGICGCGTPDMDTDGDGTADCNDECPNDAEKIAPGVCGCDVPDTDTDGDETADCNDGCPNDPRKINPGACGCGVSDRDSDRDGRADCSDRCPTDPLKTSPGVCGCGVADTDSDGDGTADCNDGCPADAGKTTPGVCGCGNADIDSDGDGTADCNDGCPADAGKTTPGVCGCGVADTDSDGDGILDCKDSCPNDAGKTGPGACGCGVPDTDSDGDGIPDCNDRDLPPVSDPGGHQVVDSETIVYLNGSASYDPDGTIVKYLWRQVDGSVIGLTAGDSAQALFVSPATMAEDVLLTFALTVTDNEGLTSTESVVVTVNRAYEESCHVPPEARFPEDGEIEVPLIPVLTVQKDLNPDSCASHMWTRWQISTAPDFKEALLVYSVQDEDHNNPLSHDVPPGVLNPDTTYYWRAEIHCNSSAGVGCTSAPSVAFSFTTGDATDDANGNGVPDNQELPGDTDLDGNGQPDNFGVHFKGVRTVVGNVFVAIETQGNILFLQSLDNQDQAILDGMPDNMPWGLINFKIEVPEPGDIAQIKIYFDQKAPKDAIFYKYDPIEGWIDYSSHAAFALDMKSVTIEIKDGGFDDVISGKMIGDKDGVANGVIVAPCGIGTIAAGGGGSDDGNSGGSDGGGCYINAVTDKK